MAAKWRRQIQAKLILGGARQLSLFDALAGAPAPKGLIAAPQARPKSGRTWIHFSGDPLIIGIEPLIIGGEG